MKSVKKKSEIIQELQAVYCDKLDSLQIPYQKVTVESTFGDTSVILTGSEGKDPLVILHAENSAAPFALEVLHDLHDAFRIIAIDLPSSIGHLIGTKSIVEVDMIEQWLFEILTWLNIENITIVGISFGAFMAIRSMAFDSRRIKRAILIAPLGLTTPEYYDREEIGSEGVNNARNIKEKYLLSTCLDEKDIDAMSFISLLSELNQIRIPKHEIAEEKLAAINTPIYIILIDEDPWTPYNDLIYNIRTKLSTLKETLLLFHTKHLPDKKHYPVIAAYIKKICNTQYSI